MKLATIGLGLIVLGSVACGSVVQPIVAEPIVEQPSIAQPIIEQPNIPVIARAEFETIKPGTCDEIVIMGASFYEKGIAENKILKVVSNDTTEIMWLYCEELWFLN